MAPRRPGKVVGTSYLKVDGPDKVTGRTLFADDLVLPRMLWCKLLRSPHAHARILSVDTAAAAAMPGVKAVLTGRDLPTPFGILPVSEDEHALCPDRVRFIGDPVAAVAAETEEQALEAANAIAVTYERLPEIGSVEDALRTQEPLIHDYGDAGNVHKRIHLEFGDTEKGFAEADEILEQNYFFEGNTHLPMEQHASLAVRTPDGKLCIWSSTQTPHYLHRALSKVLGMDAARVRVVACPNGGGFGGKSDPFNHSMFVAMFALVTGGALKSSRPR